MVSIHLNTTGAPVQAPPIVQQLEVIFAKLDDGTLLETLIGPIRRGPKGHPVKVLWHCLLAKYVMGLSSTDALIRELNNNPLVAKVCGIDSPEAIPHKSTFSRFITRLSKYKTAARLKDVSRSLVSDCYANLPGFGKRVAVDSTTLKGWVNGGKPKPSDKEARWSVKKNTQGKTEFTLGWKLHLMVDCEYELPVSASVTPGNTHDGTWASHALSEARFTAKQMFRPEYVMADKGYSSKELRDLIHRQYRAIPVIDIPSNQKKALAAYAEQLTLPEYAALKKQRGSVERAFSRLKGQRSLNRITTRGLRKVTIHCYLALIAMQVSFIQSY